MERIAINENGNAREVSVVRYIKNNENKYLIYTMGEIEGELQRIYIVKVLEEPVLTGIKVPDEEWDEVKRLIQEIVKANRANMPVEIPDLDEKSLNNIRIEDKRIIKLKADNIPTLEANKNFVIENSKEIEVEAPVIPEIEVNPVINVEPEVSPVVPAVDEPKVEPTVEATIDTPSEPEIPVVTEPKEEPTITVEPVNEPVQPVMPEIKYENEVSNEEDLKAEIEKIKDKLNRICEILKEQ